MELWWVPTTVQYADHLTKEGTPSASELLDVLRNGIIRLGDRYERPRPTQRAHSFGVVDYTFLSLWQTFHVMDVTLHKFGEEELLISILEDS